MSLLRTLSWWITDGILLDNSTDSSFFLLTPLDHTPYTCRRMLLVLASPLTVASCTFQMAGGNIGGLRLKTRRTA